MKKQPNYIEIVDNYINGNLSDCKEQVQKLDVYQSMKLLQAWKGDSLISYDEIIEIVKSLTA